VTLRDSTRGLGDLLRLVSPVRIFSTVTVALALSATEGLGLLLLLPLLQLVGVTDGSNTEHVAVLSKAFAAAHVRPTLVTVLALYILIAAFQSACQRYCSNLMIAVEQDVIYALRKRVYAALSRARWEFFVRQRSSDFTQALTSEVPRVGNAAYDAIELFVSLGVIVAYCVLALRLSPAMTLVVLLSGLVLAFLLRVRLARARDVGTHISAVSRSLYSALADHLAGMKTTKSFGAEERHIKVLDALANEVRTVRCRAAEEYGRFRQLASIGAASCLAVIVYGSMALLKLPTATLLVLLFVFARLVPRLTAAYEKSLGLVAELPAVAIVTDLERRCLAAAPSEPTSNQDITFKKRVALVGLSVHYHGREDRPALQDINLEVVVGSVTAIVGPSGAGKSTVADLLLGLMTPSAGSVVVDDQILHAGLLTSWRSQIGYVPQDPVLFHDTIRANLLWARPDASDEDLRNALRLAAAEEFVSDLPLGLETVVGDRGVQLSGGQRQRIALARALIRMPALLVLDEATNSLDAENERIVERALNRLRGHTTIVVITHRIGLVRDANMAYVLERGRVIESGPPHILFRVPSRGFNDVVSGVA
jgi:ATP-binding cassette subfamily C protein